MMFLSKKMKKVVSTFLKSGLVINSMPTAVFASDYSNHWAKNSINEWATKGVIVGYGDGIFKPNNEVTRAELAAIVTRVFGLSEKTNLNHSDVAAGSWYEDAVKKVMNLKIMNDYGDTFSPNQAATREKATYAFAKAYQISAATSVLSFSDVDAISDLQ